MEGYEIGTRINADYMDLGVDDMTDEDLLEVRIGGI